MMTLPALSASAAVIDFDNASLGTHNNYVEDGFVFDKVRVVRASCGNSTIKTCGAENAFRDTTLTRVDGGTFHLRSLWFSIISAASPFKLVTDKGSMTFALGDLVGSSVIEVNKGYVANLADNAIFGHISFLKIVDLSMGAKATGHARGNLRFDDLDVAPVPLPAAGILLIAGLGSLAMVRRRKQA